MYIPWCCIDFHAMPTAATMKIKLLFCLCIYLTEIKGTLEGSYELPEASLNRFGLVYIIQDYKVQCNKT